MCALSKCIVLPTHDSSRERLLSAVNRFDHGYLPCVEVERWTGGEGKVYLLSRLMWQWSYCAGNNDNNALTLNLK